MDKSQSYKVLKNTYELCKFYCLDVSGKSSLDEQVGIRKDRRIDTVIPEERTGGLTERLTLDNGRMHTLSTRLQLIKLS